MSNAKEIKKILGQIPTGTILTITDIQNFVRIKLSLTADDWKPYTTTRKTSYPKWKHNIQSVLAEYKREAKVIHFEYCQSYQF